MPPYPVLRTHHPSKTQPRPTTAMRAGGEDGGPGRSRTESIPAPPMRRRLGVPVATACFRSREPTSAAARIISLTRATERVESPPSSWAATPETCGAAMLVPLILLVAVLLEPTQAARIEEPGACAHTRC